jgi:hypothetical protein
MSNTTQYSYRNNKHVMNIIKNVFPTCLKIISSIAFVAFQILTVIPAVSMDGIPGGVDTAVTPNGKHLLTNYL